MLYVAVSSQKVGSLLTYGCDLRTLADKVMWVEQSNVVVNHWSQCVPPHTNLDHLVDLAKDKAYWNEHVENI